MWTTIALFNVCAVAPWFLAPIECHCILLACYFASQQPQCEVTSGNIGAGYKPLSCSLVHGNATPAILGPQQRNKHSVSGPVYQFYLPVKMKMAQDSNCLQTPPLDNMLVNVNLAFSAI